MSAEFTAGTLRQCYFKDPFKEGDRSSKTLLSPTERTTVPGLSIGALGKSPAVATAGNLA